MYAPWILFIQGTCTKPWCPSRNLMCTFVISGIRIFLYSQYTSTLPYKPTCYTVKFPRGSQIMHVELSIIFFIKFHLCLASYIQSTSLFLKFLSGRSRLTFNFGNSGLVFHNMLTPFKCCSALMATIILTAVTNMLEVF